MKRLRSLFLTLLTMAACANYSALAGENAFHKLGKDAGKAVKQAGKAGKQVGRDIGRAGKKTGKSIKDEARQLFRD